MVVYSLYSVVRVDDRMRTRRRDIFASLCLMFASSYAALAPLTNESPGLKRSLNALEVMAREVRTTDGLSVKLTW